MRSGIQRRRILARAIGKESHLTRALDQYLYWLVEKTGMSLDSALILETALQRFPPDERGHWIAEAKRLAHIVEAYGRLGRKRRLADTGRYAFVPEVLALCQQAKCTDPIIVDSEPHRARAFTSYA